MPRFSTTLAKAKSGDASARYRVAEAYALGEGVAQDAKEALRFYRLAARQNHVQAAYELAWVYLKGEGTKPDRSQALRLFKQAAEAGSDEAALLLGDSYLHGKLGVLRDPKRAAIYLLLAFRLGNQRSALLLSQTIGKRGGIAIRVLREALLATIRK